MKVVKMWIWPVLKISSLSKLCNSNESVKLHCLLHPPLLFKKVTLKGHMLIEASLCLPSTVDWTLHGVWANQYEGMDIREASSKVTGIKSCLWLCFIWNGGKHTLFSLLGKWKNLMNQKETHHSNSAWLSINDGLLFWLSVQLAVHPSYMRNEI